MSDAPKGLEVADRFKELVNELLSEGITYDHIGSTAMGLTAAMAAKSGMTIEDFMKRCEAVYEMALRYGVALKEPPETSGKN